MGTVPMQIMPFPIPSIISIIAGITISVLTMTFIIIINIATTMAVAVTLLKIVLIMKRCTFAVPTTVVAGLVGTTSFYIIGIKTIIVTSLAIMIIMKIATILIITFIARTFHFNVKINEFERSC